jgi:hypothetical protein
MTKVDINGCSIYLDETLRLNLDGLKELVRKKWDGCGLITGEEGAGKTTLALQLALYLDPTFNINKVAFDAGEFERIVDKAEPMSCVLWDESDQLGSAWASQMMQTLKRFFKRIRKKQLFLLLVTPTLWDLNKYFVIHRTRFLLHVYAGDRMERGYFKFFARAKKKNLFLYGYKTWNDEAERPDFRGRFTDVPENYPIIMDAYEAKKDAATKRVMGTVKISPEVRMAFNIEVTGRASVLNVDDKLICQLLGVTKRSLQHYREALRNQNLLKIGDVAALEAEKGENSTTILLDGLADLKGETEE